MGRLGARVGKRGEVLLFLALLDFVYAYGLLNPPRQVTSVYVWPESIAPLWVCALAWAAVGLTCLVYSFTVRDSLGFMAAVGLKVMWGGLYIIGWTSGEVDRGYLSAAIWLGFAWLVYRVAGGIPSPAIAPGAAP